MRTAIPAVLAALFAGCTVNEYDIEIIPRDDRFERTLSVRSVAPSDKEPGNLLSHREFARLAEEYGQAVPEPEKGRSNFHGTFGERTPQDVGGYGSYRQLASPCGSIMLYLERFRGSDDAVAEIDARYQAIDTLVEGLIGWCETEAGRDLEFPKLRDFLSTTFRRDLKNLSIYAYAIEFESDVAAATITGQHADPAQLNIPVRVLQYLVERDYVRPDDVPGFQRMVAVNDEPGLAELVQRTLARKLGFADDAPVPAMLDFLADPQTAVARLKTYLRASPAYQERLRLSEKKSSNNEVDPLSLLGDPLVRALTPHGFLRSHDDVHVGMHLPQQPFATNGTWDAASSEIVWDLAIETKVPRGGHELPKLCYAAWAAPNRDYQEARFGRVILNDAELAAYCLWYAGLSPEEAEEWNAFLQTFAPSDDKTDELRRFQFRYERENSTDRDNNQRPLATTAVELIFRGLESSNSK